MSVYYENENIKLLHGDMLSEIDKLERESIDCIITDPPYELGFMGKSWDGTGIVYQKTTWMKCLNVLKPGGYLLCFGASRNFYRVFCAIEDAGFEIRDTIMWLYGSGFPKGINIASGVEGKIQLGSSNPAHFKKLDGEKGVTSLGFNKMNEEMGARPSDYNGLETTIKVDIKSEEAKEWIGWNSALKPAYEPILVARKPFDGSLIDNILIHHVGAYNIDECRIGTEYINGGTAPDLRDVGKKMKELHGIDKLSFGQVENAKRIEYDGHFGRYPSNVVLSYGEEDKNEVCDGLGDEGSNARFFENCNYTEDDFEDAKRYIYCSKASKQDRDEGLTLEKQGHGKGNGLDRVCEFCGASILHPEECHCEVKSWVAPKRKNYHPTVKPTKLMRYLVRLVAPKNAVILDPFNGSGSTGKAVMLENREFGKNYSYIGIDLEKDYLEISKARIEYARTGEVINYYDSNKDSTNTAPVKPTPKKNILW